MTWPSCSRFVDLIPTIFNQNSCVFMTDLPRTQICQYAHVIKGNLSLSGASWHTHTHMAVLWPKDITFSSESAWIKGLVSSYHQTGAIGVFIDDVNNSTQEATRHPEVRWQTNPQAINNSDGKNYHQWESTGQGRKIVSLTWGVMNNMMLWGETGWELLFRLGKCVNMILTVG